MQKTWQKLKANPRLWKQYFVREKVIAAIRDFFLKQKFHEIETPLLAAALPAESYLEVFETTLLNRHRQGRRAFLTTSPEMFLKKLLVAGVGNCFSLTKAFRNTEDLSKTHNPEFTLLEWYRVGADYRDLMKDTEELFVYIYYKLLSQRVLPPAKPDHKGTPSSLGIRGSRHPSGQSMTYQGQTIDLTPPWERISMTQAFKKYARVDLEKCLTLKTITPIARRKGYQINPKTTWEELFHQIYLNEVEPHLGKARPTIIYDFPSQMAALAKKKDSDPRFAERFEVYIAGLELGDCYSELTNWQEQEERFKTETRERKRLGKISYPYDTDLIDALRVGLPKCSGLALGVDRTVMLFADVFRIQDTLLFPAEEMWT